MPTAKEHLNTKIAQNIQFGGRHAMMGNLHLTGGAGVFTQDKVIGLCQILAEAGQSNAPIIDEKKFKESVSKFTMSGRQNDTPAQTEALKSIAKSLKIAPHALTSAHEKLQTANATTATAASAPTQKITKAKPVFVPKASPPKIIVPDPQSIKTVQDYLNWLIATKKNEGDRHATMSAIHLEDLRKKLAGQGQTPLPEDKNNQKNLERLIRDFTLLGRQGNHSQQAETFKNIQQLLSQPTATATPFILSDTSGDNSVERICRNAQNNGFEVHGKANDGTARIITLHDNGRATGFKGSPDLGVVGRQMSEHREKIFRHFNMPLPPKREYPPQNMRKFVMEDSHGNNFATRVVRDSNHNCHIIHGQNARGEPRSITLHDDGSVTGYQGGKNLGVVGNQLYTHREEIFKHMACQLPPSHTPSRSPSPK